MEQPITVTFRWSAEDLVHGTLYHRRQIWRPIFRVISGILVCSVLAVCAIASIRAYGQGDFSGAYASGLFVVLIGLLWLFRYTIFRWSLRRQFAKRPDHDIELVWEITPDKIVVRSSLGNSELCWEAFAKVLRTPKGFLFYPIPKIFHFIPRRGFNSDAEFERVAELARQKVKDFRLVI